MSANGMSANGDGNGADAPGWPAPRENPELVGHEPAEQTLIQAYRSGRLAHAWLIAGPEGIGKATLAFRFARFVLAQGKGEARGPAGAAGGLEIDPAAAVFRRIAAGGHGDLLTVTRGPDPKSGKMRSEIVVADVRAVSAFLRMTPAEGGWRVVVVDCADEMNRHAANALLKILEEPPARALLLVVSHNPGRLPATIRSRCRRLVLRPLSAAGVGGVLARLRPDMAAAEREALAAMAEGSPGRALRLAAEGGVEIYRDVVGLLASLPALDAVALHRLGDRLGRPGAEALFHTAAGLLGWWLARMIRLGARGEGAAAEEREIVAGEGEARRRLLAGASLEQWVEVWEKITRLFAQADSINLDRKQVVLSAFLAVENAARP